MSMIRSLKVTSAALIFSALAFHATATSLDVLEEWAQQEVIGYMQEHGMEIQHGPAIVSGSFEKIVLRASFFRNGKQKIATFVIDPTWDEGTLPIRSVTIR